MWNSLQTLLGELRRGFGFSGAGAEDQDSEGHGSGTGSQARPSATNGSPTPTSVPRGREEKQAFFVNMDTGTGALVQTGAKDEYQDSQGHGLQAVSSSNGPPLPTPIYQDQDSQDHGSQAGSSSTNGSPVATPAPTGREEEQNGISKMDTGVVAVLVATEAMDQDQDSQGQGSQAGSSAANGFMEQIDTEAVVVVAEPVDQEPQGHGSQAGASATNDSPAPDRAPIPTGLRRSTRPRRRTLQFQVVSAPTTPPPGPTRRSARAKKIATIIAKAKLTLLRKKKKGKSTGGSKSKTGVGKNYICSVCFKGFTQKANCQTHERIHTGERPYPCGECGKAFKTKGARKIHALTHSGVKPFKCDLCQLEFRQLNNLQYHQNREHSTHAPAPALPTRSSRPKKSSTIVKSHELAHTEYPCEDCGKSFPAMYNLELHKVLVHTGARPYLCEFCGKTFLRKNNLRRHAAVSHSGLD